MRQETRIITVLIALSLSLGACSGSPQAPMLPDDAHFSTRCVQILSSRPADIRVQGLVALADYGRGSALYIKGLADNTLFPIAAPDETIGQISPSPDHRVLAFQRGDPKTNTWSLVIADAGGQRIKVVPWEEGFFNLGAWINESQILVSGSQPLLVFDPYTENKSPFEYSDFPDYMLDNISNRYVFFDPGLTRAVYKNTADRNSLVDLKTGVVLAELDNHPDPAPVAAWSPGGDQVAVVGTLVLAGEGAAVGRDLFGISRDGTVSQLTHLTEHFKQQLMISPSGMNWSPDSRYIAFWFVYPDGEATVWQLGVHDVVAQKTTNYCISNVPNSTLTAYHPLPVPIWSPDGSQLLVENRYDLASSRLVILDLGQQRAFQVGENVFPVAWLKAPDR